MKNHALLSALLLTTTLSAQNGADYMPLQAGNTWTYSGPKGMQVITSVDRAEEINGVPCAVLTTKVQGQAVNEEWLSIQDGALRSYQNRTPQTGFEITFGKPIVRLNFPVKNADRWTSSTMDQNQDTIRGSYVVEFPALLTIQGRNLECAKVAATMKSAQGQMTVDTWYAQGIGIVKQAFDSGNGPMAFELADFKVQTPPRQKPAVETQEEERPQPVREGLACEKCSNPLRPGTKFCGECGAAAPKPRAKEPRFCVGCSAKLALGTKFCGECGAKVEVGPQAQSRETQRAER